MITYSYPTAGVGRSSQQNLPFPIMENEQNNKTVSAAETQQGVKKLKFSEIDALMDGQSIDMDVPGVLLVVTAEHNVSNLCIEGLAERSKRRLVLPMLAAGLTHLCHEAMHFEPKALAVVAEWFGRESRDNELSGKLQELLRKF